MKVSMWLIAVGYWLTLIAYFFYSYSQIDLNLTLFSNYFYQTIQKQLIYLGYFNRHLSAFIYLIMVFALFSFYFLLLKSAKGKKITIKNIRLLIITTALILLFAYPCFSHDIFNYIFDIRILVYHQASPWTHTALDFPGDLWTRFMHWTHRTYPYGPFWIVASIIPYLLGLGKFVLTLFNFKLLLSLSYLGSCWLIYKISQKIYPGSELKNLTLFAFNPLVLNESLISPHLDIFMTFLGLLAFFLWLENKKITSSVFWILSVLTKYATLGYSPIYLPKLKIGRKIQLAFLFTLVAIITQISIREILPWYFLPLIPLVIFMQAKLANYVLFGLSLGGLIYYLPYLYIGEYGNLIDNLRIYFFFAPILLSLFLYFAGMLKLKDEKKP